MKQSLYEIHKSIEQGYRITWLAGTAHYGDPMAEHLAVRSIAGIMI
jgi:hypothetical protein